MGHPPIGARIPRGHGPAPSICWKEIPGSHKSNEIKRPFWLHVSSCKHAVVLKCVIMYDVHLPHARGSSCSCAWEMMSFFSLWMASYRKTFRSLVAIKQSWQQEKSTRWKKPSTAATLTLLTILPTKTAKQNLGPWKRTNDKLYTPLKKVPQLTPTCSILLLS